MKKNYLLMVLCTSMFLVKISVTEAQTTLKQRLEKHVYTLADDSLKGRHSGSTYGHKAAEYIVNQWKEIGIPPYQSDTYFQPFNNNCKNIIGILHGNDSTLKNEYIIIGAHYDHLGFKLNNGDTIIYNGADDNASGVATLIELSRKLNEIRHSLQRSVILVAFDAEETGLNGSSHLADNPVVPLTNIKLMFSVDMVGWYKASGYVQYSGAGTIADSKNILLNSGLVPEGLHVVTQDFEKSLFTATDTQPFAQKGIPTLAVTTGLKSPYHKPEDDADLIDYDGMTLIVEHLANVVETVSKDRNYSASGKLASKHIKRNPKKILVGLSANLGSNYHYYTAGAVNGKAADSYGIGLMSQINMGQWAIRPEVYYEYVQAKYPAGTIR
ncbi:MAG: M20/M25/M40 family metallo-hydrolase, partial [Prevotellaceae bacterium]|nr:M20/M25/M40 family metallo-hydrolase [Prevotellaceae bacterium]